MTIGFMSHHADWGGALVAGGDALATWATDTARYARQAVCGARGHAMHLGFRPHRLFLQCAQCGYESPGWEIGARCARQCRPRADRNGWRSSSGTSSSR